MTDLIPEWCHTKLWQTPPVKLREYLASLNKAIELHTLHKSGVDQAETANEIRLVYRVMQEKHGLPDTWVATQLAELDVILARGTKKKEEINNDDEPE